MPDFFLLHDYICLVNVVIDMGNTLTKVATFQNSTFLNLQTCSAKEVNSLLASFKFDMGLICSVKEDVYSTNVLEQNSSILKLEHGLQLPIDNTYSTPESLGFDRLSNAIGAFTIEPNTNSLIIDAGTCLKFDFIDAENRYLGGAISPGLSMRLESLHNFTDKLPLVELKKPNKLIGDSTIQSIRSGVVHGMIAEINNLIDLYHKKYSSLKVFITGGDLDFIYPMVDNQKSSIFAHNYITLLGMHTILQENVS